MLTKAYHRHQVRERDHLNWVPTTSLYRRIIVAGFAVCAAIFLFAQPRTSFGRLTAGQELRQTRIPAHGSRFGPPTADEIRINREISVICSDRVNDPSGSEPIDDMQTRASLPLSHPKVQEGLARAERLLPIARQFEIEAIREIGRENNLSDAKIEMAIRRIEGVTKIEPDMDLRDNASVYYENQHFIHFGTIFLAGLQSDEGMISVIGHELTHIASGRAHALQPVFKLNAERASRITGFSIEGGRPEELTCDLMGVLVARKYIERNPTGDALVRRLSRSVEHNCVTRDDTDDVHLSPRNTLRALLALDTFLAKATNP